MEKEQQEFIETWSKKRDFLVNEVSDLTKEKEVKEKELSVINESVKTMTSELDSWKDKTAEVAESYGSTKSSLETEIKFLNEVSSVKKEEVINLDKSIDKLTIKKDTLNSEIKELSKVVETAKDLVLSISSVLPNLVNEIRSEIISVKQAVSDVDVSVNYFKDVIIAKEIAQANKDVEQINKETYLKQREVVLDNMNKTKNKTK